MILYRTGRSILRSGASFDLQHFNGRMKEGKTEKTKFYHLRYIKKIQ